MCVCFRLTRVISWNMFSMIWLHVKHIYIQKILIFLPTSEYQIKMYAHPWSTCKIFIVLQPPPHAHPIPPPPPPPPPPTHTHTHTHTPSLFKICEIWTWNMWNMNMNTYGTVFFSWNPKRFSVVIMSSLYWIWHLVDANIDMHFGKLWSPAIKINYLW